MAKYCLKCKTRTEVLSTRYVPEKNHIRRIRICKNCGYKFITHEQEYKRKKRRGKGYAAMRTRQCAGTSDPDQAKASCVGQVSG